MNKNRTEKLMRGKSTRKRMPKMTAAVMHSSNQINIK